MAPASDKLCKCSKSSNHHLEKGDIHDSVAYLGLNKKTLPFSVTDSDADNPLNILPNQEEFAESKGIHIGQEIGRTNCLVTVDEGARDVRPNPGSSTVLVTVRSIAQLDGLDPKSVTLVLTEDESREDRALIVREAKKRHFSLFNDVTLQQASLACFMQNLQQQFELIDAENDSKDANYTPTDDEEEEEEEKEKLEKDKEKLEKEKKEKEKEKEKEEQEQEQQQEEEEKEKRKEKEQKKEQQYEELDPSYKPDFSDDQELPEQHVDFCDLIGQDEELVPDYMPNFSEDAGSDADQEEYERSVDFCDLSWLWFSSESEVEETESDSDYSPSEF